MFLNYLRNRLDYLVYGYIRSLRAIVSVLKNAPVHGVASGLALAALMGLNAPAYSNPNLTPVPSLDSSVNPDHSREAHTRNVAKKTFESDEDKGRAVFQHMLDRDTGWRDFRADVTMTLRNKRGQENDRQLHISGLEVQGDGNKGITVFNSPRDVKGTALLTHSHAVDADDQWLYLPSVSRVKRISSRSKAGRFMGSEFSYEDMSSFEIEKHEYKYLRDEQLKKYDCFVVESIPKDKYSGYTRQVNWLDKTYYRVRKVDFYDRKGALLKTLNHSRYQLYKGRHWRPHVSLMENHQTAVSTTLEWNNLTFDTGLTPKNFDQVSLKRSK